MNNIHYIVRSVRRFVLSHYLIEQVTFHFTYWYVAFNIYIFFFRSEAKDVLGDDWVQIQRRIVQQHANQYKRVSWAKVCSSNHSQFSLQFLQFILVTFEAFTGICYLFLFPNPASYWECRILRSVCSHLDSVESQFFLDLKHASFELKHTPFFFEFLPNLFLYLLSLLSNLWLHLFKLPLKK